MSLLPGFNEVNFASLMTGTPGLILMSMLCLVLFALIALVVYAKNQKAVIRIFKRYPLILRIYSRRRGDVVVETYRGRLDNQDGLLNLEIKETLQSIPIPSTEFFTPKGEIHLYCNAREEYYPIQFEMDYANVQAKDGHWETIVISNLAPRVSEEMKRVLIDEQIRRNDRFNTQTFLEKYQPLIATMMLGIIVIMLAYVMYGQLLEGGVPVANALERASQNLASVARDVSTASGNAPIEPNAPPVAEPPPVSDV